MARTIRLLALLALFLAFPLAVLAAPTQIPGEVIVKYRNNPSSAQRANIRSQLHSNSKRKFWIIDAEVLRVEGMTVEQAIAAARQDPRVEYAEPNYEVHAFVTPNDPRFEEMWSLENTGQTGGSPNADIRATQAWDVFTGNPNLKVGVIDTGIDYTHPDLVDNVWTNPGEIPGNFVDDDGNGYVDDIHGYDFVNGDGDPMDDHGHGTHVSGTIAARGDNGIGTVGVNWRAQIVGIKFLSAGGSGSTEGAIAAIEYAVTVGVRLTNNSWGGGPFSLALQEAIAAAGAAGQLFVAAAGNNDGNNNDIVPVYPASYPVPAIVAVAATNHNDQLAVFSNFGPTSVHIAAPGADILSTFPGGYRTLSGTSMATPHVTGALTLLLGRKPALTGAAAKAILLAAADSIPSLAGKVLGGARLNAFVAVADPDTTPPGVVTDLDASLPTSNTITLSWHATGDDGAAGRAAQYDVRFSTAPITSANVAAATRAMAGVPLPLPAGSLQTYEVPGLAFSTQYYFALRALDDFDNAGPISNVPDAITLGAPDISAAPASFQEALFTGQTAHHTLELRNDGAGTLDFVIPNPQSVGAPQLIHPYQEIPKGAADPRVGPAVEAHRGGPDAFGYRWIDSDDVEGPDFQWNDITTTGTPLTGLIGDEEVLTEVPIGFEFPFYGTKFTTVNVAVNGWLSFTSTAVPTYSNQPLPNGGALVPENLIAPFWTDFHFRGEPKALVFRDASRFIITYREVQHYLFGGSYEFQVVLHRSGEIRYQYQSMIGPTQFETIGIQNATKTDGLTIAFNTRYVHAGLAISILPPLEWLNVTPKSGRIGGGQTQTLNVDFDAAGLFGGTLRANLVVSSNDPDESPFSLPVQLDVTGVPDVALSPLSFDFGPVFVDGAAIDTLVVDNRGTDTLRVASIVSSNPAYSVDPAAFTLAPFGRALVQVSFAPQTPGNAPGTLTLSSNDPDASVLAVPVSGLGIEPPDIAVDPESLGVSLLSGQTATRTLRIENSGTAELTVALTVEGVVTGAAVAPPTTLTLRAPSDDPPRSGLPETPLIGPTPNVTAAPGPPRASAGTYAGTFLEFGISDLGEVMPFRYRGEEQLSVGARISGYTVGFLDAGSPRVYTAGYETNNSMVAMSFQELVNTPALVVAETVSKTFDDQLRITRRFAFPRNQKYLQIQTRVENISGRLLEGLVVKEFADWDVDNDYADDTWADDPQYHMAWASDAHYVAIASAETPSLIDVNGWPDYGTYATFVELPGGPFPNFDGLELLHFDCGVIAPGASQRISTAYCGGDDLTDLRRVAVVAVPSGGWLSLDPQVVSVPAGQSRDVTVTFDARNLFAGDYEARIVVASNDPDESQIHIPAQLHVTGAPDIAVSSTSVAFGGVFVGVTTAESLTVANAGTDVLNVTSVVTNHGDFNASPASFMVDPGLAQVMVVTFTPSSAVTRTATLAIASDDPDETSVAVALSGDGLIPPVASVTPESLSVTLFTGASAHRALRLTNSGGSGLDYAISIESTDAPGPGVALAAGTAAPRRIDPGETTPWAFYAARDGWSTQSPAVPPAATAGLLPIVIEDPVGDAPYPDLIRLRGSASGGTLRMRVELGMPFDAANFGGAISLDTDQNASTGGPPTFGLPGQDIGVEYEVLMFGTGFGIVDLVRRSDNFLIGTFPITNTGTGFEFAISLAALDGDDGALDVTGVIGTNLGPTDWFPQVGHGSIGGASWLSVTPDAGQIEAGQHFDLDVTFDAAGLNGGDYSARLDIVSNDPGAGAHLVVPVRLHVIGASDLAIVAEFELHPNNLNRNSHGNWVQGQVTLPAGWDPHAIAISTVRVQNSVPVDTDGPISYHGQTVKYKFDRAALMAQIPDGDAVPVKIVGQIGDSVWFSGLDVVRMLRPEVASSAVAEYAASSRVPLSWSDAANHPAARFDLWFSANGGEAWTLVAGGLTQRAFTWTVPAQPTEEGRLELVAFDASGAMGNWFSQDFKILPGTTGVSAAAPLEFALRSATENPVRGSVVLELAVPMRAAVEVAVYDVRGARIRDVARGELDPGWHRLRWDGTHAGGQRVAPGVYFIRAKAAGKTYVTRIAMVW